MKVKNKKKLKKEQVKYPVFGFQYIDLSSKQYSIEYFQKNKGLPIVSVFGSLFDKLKRISSVPLLVWQIREKLQHLRLCPILSLT